MLNNICVITNAEPEEIDAYKARLARAKDLFKEVEELDRELITADSDQLPQAEEVFETMIKIETILKRLIRQCTPIAVPSNETTMPFMSSTVLNTTHHSGTKLPKLVIPKFNGDPLQWQSFFDLFTRSIHDNQGISAAQKMGHLLTLLTPEAEKVIHHLPISDANYVEALKLLKNRFDKKGHLINSYIKTFLSMPTVRNSNATELRNLLDTTNQIIRGLSTLGPQTEERDPWLIYLLINKLDSDTQSAWAQSTTNKEFNTITELLTFLETRSDALESMKTYTRQSTTQTFKAKPLRGHVSTEYSKCSICNTNDHQLYACVKFKSLSVQQRRQCAKSDNRCFNCLVGHHGVFRCMSRNRCNFCKRKHHTLLHDESTEPNGNSSVESIKSNSTQLNSEELPSTSNEVYSITQSHIVEHLSKHAILPTALLNVTNQAGQKFVCRALLDSGSASSFITENCCQRLKFPRRNGRRIVTGVGNSKAGTTNGITKLFITPISNANKHLEVDAYIMSTITGRLPDFTIDQSQLQYLKGIPLADPSFNVSSEIDILIGIEHFFNIMKSNQIRGSNNQPVAQETIFGYIIGGKWDTDAQPLQVYTTTLHPDNPENHLDVLLKRFWEIEEVDCPKRLTQDEEACEAHFIKTMTRKNGRFVLRLPLKETENSLGTSLPLAISCMKSVERKFQKDRLYKEQYVKFMTEYENLNHMKEISNEEAIKPGYYIPHHGILKVTNNVVKFRVVFNGSAKTSSGESLNDQLLVGPTVQSTLYSIIVRFRQHKFVFTCDIEKMYRQFNIHPHDCHLQRIVWRPTCTEPIKHYELQTVTYGTASAPYLATKALRQLGIENENSYSTAAKVLKDDVYVDDIMTGTNSISEAKELKNDIIKVLSEAGMRLSKWVSNANAILEDVELSDQQQPKNICLQETVSVLGVKWAPITDEFIFKVDLSPNNKITKRTILSEASQIFDPIGWLAPVIIRIKILYQSLWLISVAWDDDLPHNLQNQWRVMKSELKDIEKITIKRWYETTTDHVELHGYGDASELAFGAAIYIRTKTDDENWNTSLVSAKTKVAPIKKISIPRLELCASVLLVQLMEQVKQSISVSVHKIFYWTDSTTVLGWLSSHPSRWSTFIANRTSQILQLTSRDQWYHVTSMHNPADIASRGMSPQQLQSCSIWWNGPHWLSKDESTWPKQSHYSTVIEAKSEVTVLITTHKNMIIDKLLNTISTLHKITKILAFCIRFINNCKCRGKHNLKTKKGLIQREEINSAMILILKHSQSEEFNAELCNINQHQSISKSSKIASLNPFLDSTGVLRVGGRLSNALIPYETKHQIILSSKSIVTRLLVEDYHHRFFHASSSLLNNLLRHKFWIIRCKDIIKQVTQSCIHCFRSRPHHEEQMMGNLPLARVELVRPFIKVGCDFCGPVMTYYKRGRGQKPIKSYICLFVCFGTKAVHLELVGDLSSESFLAALRRLTCRRGPCSDIYSDCGTNFVGANNYLKEVYEFLKRNNEHIHYSLLRNNITWHFNPPGSPHQGGLWESMVKIVKTHLIRTTGDHILTVEELQTLLCEIENVVNSRPISVLSIDTIEALTPAHFLLHHAATYVPSINYEDEKISNLNKWQLIQKLVQHFWRRWYNEYLILLQARSKWTVEKHNIKIDDVVVVRDENMPPTKWKLGRVEDVIPGADNLVRVVKLKTENGLLTRPIQKVCKLPFN